MTSRRSPFVWTRLHLPLPTSIESAKAAITALASIAGQPRVVLEVVGRTGEVSWKLGCDAHVRTRLLAALEAHLVGLRHEDVPSTFDGLRADRAASVRLAGSRTFPLRHDSSETTVRGLLAALSQTRRSEAVYVQITLGPRSRPSRSPEVETADRRAVAIKHAEHRFGCEIRVAASANDPARVRTLIDGAASALRALEVPGVHVRLVRSSLTAFSRASSPWIWPLHLSISDVVPFTGWPIGTMPLPGVPAAHPRLMPAVRIIPSTGRVLGNATAAAATERPVAIKTDDSLRHLHVMGPTGVGKSTLLAHLALADIAHGRCVVVIDPKGDLVDDILERIPSNRLDDVVVLDARDDSVVGLNGLAASANPDLAADSMLAVFHSLYSDSWGPRTHDILHACLLTLAKRGDASLPMIPMLLTNPGFRRSVVGRVVKADPMGLGSFWSWYDGISEAERSQVIAPLMNKLRPVLMRPGIRGILGQRQPKFALTDVFTKRRILLVSLAKGVIGPEAAQLLGSLVVSMLWGAALGRVGVPADRRHPVMVHIDEVQDYLRLPGDLGDALAQARGLGVGFTLAHQHLGQLSPSIRDAVMANARSRVAFQLSNRDAREIAKLTRGELQPEDFEALPAFHAYASLLVDGSPAPWTSITTRPPTVPINVAADVRARSRQSYGVPLSEIDADLLGLIEPTHPGADRIGRARRSPTSKAEGGSDD